MSLELAITLAKRNPIVGLPKMGVVLHTRYDGTYLGWNQRKTHPLAKKFGKHDEALCLHAEVDAIRKAVIDRADLSRATMYVARVLKNGTPALAKPCIGCQRAILAFGIGEVEWTK